MKIHWMSNAPWAKTGYGNQTALVVPRLKKLLGHDMSIFAFYGLEGGVLNWHDGIRIYPRAYHPYGNDIAAANSSHAQADIMISLMDAWVLNPSQIQMSGVKWVPWFPIDMEPLPPPVKASVEKAYRRIVFSKFGCQQMDDAGLQYSYVPHCVDTNVFSPGSMADVRKMLNWPEDKFIIGMVAANKGQPSRKAFTVQLEAFAQFHANHPDTLMYLHTATASGGENQGVNLPEFIRFLGLENAVMFADQYTNVIGFPDEYMVNAYRGMDVMSLVSMGEGFGVPLIEAQACGTPVITGDWTAMSELCFGGWMVDKSEADKVWTPLGAYQWQPRIDAVLDCYELAYSDRGNISRRNEARVKALDYDADKVVAEYWAPALEAIEKSLKTAKQMPAIGMVKR